MVVTITCPALGGDMAHGGVGVPQLPRQGSAGTLVDPGALTRGLSHSVSFAWLWSQTRALSACSVPRPVLVSCGQLLLGFLGNLCGSTSCCCCGQGAHGQLCEHHPSLEGRLSSVGCSARGSPAAGAGTALVLCAKQGRILSSRPVPPS